MNRSTERGFTLIAAVFLIAILALLSAYLVNLRVYQDTGVSIDALGARAFTAARAGAEWGAYNSLRNNACAAATSVPLGGTLAGFTATVTCARTTHDEAGVAIQVDTLVSTACNQPTGGGNCPNPAPGAYYVERQITVTVGQP
ncbi:MAG TPA: type II secretion system protein [Burkholderiales bacterium]|nr:type II secretion system protein [Burkholderiales bacterium]